jgi:hypothetical protein
MGWLLDRWPGAAGHELVFLVMTGFSLAGLLAAIGFRGTVAKK